jgi:hypothetical protein
VTLEDDAQNDGDLRAGKEEPVAVKQVRAQVVEREPVERGHDDDVSGDEAPAAVLEEPEADLWEGDIVQESVDEDQVAPRERALIGEVRPGERLALVEHVHRPPGSR